MLERLIDVWDQAVAIWLAGGWAMIGIAVIAFVMFAVGMRVHIELVRKQFRSVNEETWRLWIDRPKERRGPVGDLLDFVSSAASSTDRDIAAVFTELRAQETAPFERDLRVMKVCVSAAPLVGLLGTVTGMLSTFGALAFGSGGDQTMDMVAKGISEALITTETGLVIALPGLFFQYQLARRFDQYRAFLAHLETAWTQLAHRRAKTAERALARRLAASEIATTLADRLGLGTAVG